MRWTRSHSSVMGSPSARSLPCRSAAAGQTESFSHVAGEFCSFFFFFRIYWVGHGLLLSSVSPVKDVAWFRTEARSFHPHCRLRLLWTWNLSCLAQCVWFLFCWKYLYLWQILDFNVQYNISFKNKDIRGGIFYFHPFTVSCLLQGLISWWCWTHETIDQLQVLSPNSGLTANAKSTEIKCIVWCILTISLTKCSLSPHERTYPLPQLPPQTHPLLDFLYDKVLWATLEFHVNKIIRIYSSVWLFFFLTKHNIFQFNPLHYTILIIFWIWKGLHHIHQILE